MKARFGLLMMSLALCACATATGPMVSVADQNLDTLEIVKGEAAVIAASPGRARRQGDVLTVTLANGRTVTWTNDNKGCDDGPSHCDGFVLVADWPQAHWFLIFETLYEGGNFHLIDDRDGRRTDLPYWPILSPDGSRLLILNDDESGYFEGDSLEIWRREGSRAEREWIANPDAADTGVATPGVYHIKALTWQGDRITLAFSTDETFNTKTNVSVPGRQWTGTLVREAGGWVLDARAPKQ